MAHVRLGTRSSPMALHQAEQVAAALEALDPTVTTELIKVTTSGDQWMGDLAKLGGKGAFVREIDRNLLDGSVDLAVHCLKDIPGDVPAPQGLTVAAYLAREDVRDAVISRTGATLAELPEGAVIGTSAVRRAAQLRLHHPHLEIKPLRGNVNTRLMRLDEGHFGAIVAAVAGLRRVNEAHRITEILPLETMCPAVGAGPSGTSTVGRVSSLTLLSTSSYPLRSKATILAPFHQCAALEGSDGCICTFAWPR